MALNVYFPDNISDGLVADVILVINTATVRGALNEDYLRGVISLALAQAISYGIPRLEFASRVRRELSQDTLNLLEAVL